MKRGIILLCCVLLLSAWFPHGKPSSSGYVGPGDLVPSGSSSYDVWVGLRAFSQAQLGGTTKAVKVCDNATGLICKDLNILPTGYVDTSGLTGGGQACAGGSPTSAPTCYIAEAYDQATGNNSMLSNHVPGIKFVFDGPNGYPAMYNPDGRPDGTGSGYGLEVVLLDTGIPYIQSVLVYGMDAYTGDFHTIASQGGENLAFGDPSVGSCPTDNFDFLYGGSYQCQTGGTRNAWHSVTIALAGGGQGAPGQGLGPIGDCLVATLATDGTGHVTTSTSGICAGVSGIAPNNNYNVNDPVGFAHGGFGDPVLPPEIARGKAYYIKTSGNPFTISATPGGATILFSAFSPVNEIDVAPALSYFMTDKSLSTNCNPCWGGLTFGYSPKSIFHGDSRSMQGYILEWGLWSSRGTAMSTANMQLINANQCQAYGGLC